MKLSYNDWMKLHWSRMVKEYMARPEGNQQGWVSWTYDAYQKETQEARARV